MNAYENPADFVLDCLVGLQHDEVQEVQSASLPPPPLLPLPSLVLALPLCPPTRHRGTWGSPCRGATTTALPFLLG